jgi:hypothetical protein
VLRPKVNTVQIVTYKGAVAYYQREPTPDAVSKFFYKGDVCTGKEWLVTLGVRSVISIALLMIIVAACSYGFGRLGISLAAYLIGGRDYVELVLQPQEITEYEGVIVFTGIFSVITGVLIGLFLWRWLIKNTGLVPLDFH